MKGATWNESLLEGVSSSTTTLLPPLPTINNNLPSNNTAR